MDYHNSFNFYLSVKLIRLNRVYSVMYKENTISVIIPAHNEARSIGQVVGDLLSLKNNGDARLIDDIVVCDNASTDQTHRIAKDAGARVVYEATPGYGSACLAAIAALNTTDIVIFIDGDASVNVNEVPLLLNSVIDGADLVIGTRVINQQEPGSLLPQQRFGNTLATYLIRSFWSVSVTDLGPFRAIPYKTLLQLSMSDQRFGWTVEMQIKSIQQGLNIVECPVSTRKRIGHSKISGTLKGTTLACLDIFSTIFKLRWKQTQQLHYKKFRKTQANNL